MRKHITSSRLLIAALALTGVLGSAVNTTLVQAQTTTPAGADQAAQPAQPASDTSVSAPSKSFVPVLSRNYPFNSVLGVETGSVTSGSGATTAGPTWVRRNALRWDAVEPTEGARNWSAIAALEEDMKQAAAQHLRLSVIIWGTPAWAQQNAGSVCGPIRNDKIAAFAAFMRDVAGRYGQPPYSVKYWEIWNEMDLPSDVNPTAAYGCWGNKADPYYGGGYYASVLKQVSPQIRAADPSAKIMTGGLLFDCAPDKVAGCTAGKYFEGIIRGGGAPYFDIVNFHAYDGFDIAANQVGHYDWKNWVSSWNTTGPSVIVKAQYLKKIMNQYGITGKPLINTEVALLCWTCESQPTNFGETKANYIAQTYSAAIAEGLIGNVWYSWEGWFQSQLSDAPVLAAYKVAGQKLAGAIYIGAVSNSDVGAGGVKGYKFSREGRTLWVLWSLDGGSKSITLPSTPLAITDASGGNVGASKTFQLTIKPVYVEY